MRALLALLCLAAPAQSQEWIGDWAGEPEWCEFADRIGSHTPAPIRFTAEEMIGYENSCGIVEVNDIGVGRGWAFELSCYSEGSSYEENWLLLLENTDIAWIWRGGGPPLSFTRCTE